MNVRGAAQRQKKKHGRVNFGAASSAASLLLYFVLLRPPFKWLLAAPGRSLQRSRRTARPVCNHHRRTVRATGLAISYNIAVTVFRGFGQFIVTGLLRVTGSLLTPAFHPAFGAAPGIAGGVLLDKAAARSQTYSHA